MTSGEEAALLAVGPVGEAAAGLGGLDSGVEAPELLAGGGVEREDFFGGAVDEDGAADDERTGLQAAFGSDIDSPG